MTADGHHPIARSALRDVGKALGLDLAIRSIRWPTLDQRHLVPEERCADERRL